MANVTDKPRYTISAEREPGDQREEENDYEAEAAAHVLMRAKEIQADEGLMNRVRFHLARRKEKSEREERLAKEFI